MRKLPPAVIPKQTPDNIITSLMDFSERDMITKYIATYQKTRPDWDTFRNKIPEKLLLKWQKVLISCRLNGFISPRVENENLIWQQILGFPRNYENIDQCTLCARSQRAGDCHGRKEYKNSQLMFKTCWS